MVKKNQLRDLFMRTGSSFAKNLQLLRKLIYIKTAVIRHITYITLLNFILIIFIKKIHLDEESLVKI